MLVAAVRVSLSELMEPVSTVSGQLGPGVTLGLLLAGVGLLALVFWPRWGAIARRRHAEELRDRMLSEDVLKHLYKVELQERRPTLQSVAGAAQVSLARAVEVVGRLQKSGLAEVAGEELRLSPTGRQYALNIVRAHRLWEQHLAEQTGVAESEWHREAERQEHFISPQEADVLAAQLGHPAYDPHGDPIPTPDGRLAPGAGQPLATLAPGQWGRILRQRPGCRSYGRWRWQYSRPECATIDRGQESYWRPGNSRTPPCR